MRRPRTPTPAEDRFWPKVAENADGCWVWQARRDPCGYGHFKVVATAVGKKTIGAHRFAWQQIVGVIPQGFELDHLCRNRACVNPAHLELVTHRENSLRGRTVVALNAAKTHCPRGHEYTSSNTRTYRGRRHCRACNRDRREQHG